MVERDIDINGDIVPVARQTLTENSPKLKYFIEVLNFAEIDIDDFSIESVCLFLTLLERG